MNDTFNKVMYLIVALFLVTSCSSYIENIFPPPPEGWVVFPLPAANSPALECASYSSLEWTVSLKDGQVMIHPYSQRIKQDGIPFPIPPDNVAEGLAGNRHVLKLHDGWLVGFDAGEFGGALWWLSEEGETWTKLADGNVIGFTESSVNIFVFVGLAHLTFDDGKVLILNRENSGPPTIQILVELGSAPWTFVMESSDSILTLTTKGLYRVTGSGNVHELKKTHYHFLYPNSMVRLPSGALYIGMRHFVICLNPTKKGYKEQWLVPQYCQDFELKDLDCHCLEQ